MKGLLSGLQQRPLPHVFISYTLCGGNSLSHVKSKAFATITGNLYGLHHRQSTNGLNRGTKVSTLNMPVSLLGKLHYLCSEEQIEILSDLKPSLSSIMLRTQSACIVSTEVDRMKICR